MLVQPHPSNRIYRRRDSFKIGFFSLLILSFLLPLAIIRKLGFLLGSRTFFFFTRSSFFYIQFAPVGYTAFNFHVFYNPLISLFLVIITTDWRLAGTNNLMKFMCETGVDGLVSIILSLDSLYSNNTQ